MSITDNPEEADILLVNTCGFIQPAVEEGIEAILALVAIKGKKPGSKLVVTGCMVQRYGLQLAKELPEVDLFLGVDGVPEVAARLADLTSEPEFTLSESAPSYLMDSLIPRTLSTPPFRAYLKVTEGCSNRCTYCLIPSLRGPLRSRPIEDLLIEARLLADSGVKELTLVAQDLTAYGMDFGPGRERLLDLLQGLLQETNIPWIRMLYLYPMRVKDALLDFVAAYPRILPYFDIPLQHISDRILQAMNRPYTRVSVEKLIRDIRARIPGAALRTTFMVGFPGENETDVNQLSDFMDEFKIDHVGIFTYSNEEGCAAAELADQCPEEVKLARKALLMEKQSQLALTSNQQLIGSIQEVLVEGTSRETELLLEGRTRFQAADIDGCVYITSGFCNPGDLVKVRITEAHPYDLVGEILGSEDEQSEK